MIFISLFGEISKFIILITILSKEKKKKSSISYGLGHGSDNSIFFGIYNLLRIKNRIIYELYYNLIFSCS